MSMEQTESAKMGRPTKLTPKLQAEFITALASGCYIETAAAFVGIHKETYYSWFKRGTAEKARVDAGHNGNIRVRQAEQPYVDFSDSVSRALAQAEFMAVAQITIAGKEDWRAHAWRLKHRHPERWARGDRMEVTGEGGGPVQVEVNTVADLVMMVKRAKAKVIEGTARDVTDDETPALEEGLDG